jgi:hypothetical protein
LRGTETALRRPGAEQFAVALDERVTLKLREALSVFVGLGLPHAKHGLGASMPKVVDELGVLVEMIIQGSPLKSNECAHGGEFSLRTFCFCLRN